MSRVSLEEMEELRQDMLREAWEDERYEVEMRSNDDYFYDAITDMFSAEINELMVNIEEYCENYGRSADDWIAILLQK